MFSLQPFHVWKLFCTYRHIYWHLPLHISKILQFVQDVKNWLVPLNSSLSSHLNITIFLWYTKYRTMCQYMCIYCSQTTDFSQLIYPFACSQWCKHVDSPNISSSSLILKLMFKFCEYWVIIESYNCLDWKGSFSSNPLAIDKDTTH